MKRQVCEWNKVGQDTWEPKHVTAEYLTVKTTAFVWGEEEEL